MACVVFFLFVDDLEFRALFNEVVVTKALRIPFDDNVREIFFLNIDLYERSE